MCTKKNRILSWLLITVMVMLPLRSALAFNLADCQMQHEQSLAASQAMPDTMRQAMIDHSEHMMSGTAQAGAGDSIGNSAVESHKCCNDKDMMCNSDCASVINMSFVIQSPSLIETYYHSVLTAQTTTDVLLRALPPLDRPPAYLQS
jgi:hypothetical protein